MVAYEPREPKPRFSPAPWFSFLWPGLPARSHPAVPVDFVTSQIAHPGEGQSCSNSSLREFSSLLPCSAAEHIADPVSYHGSFHGSSLQ